MTKSTYSFTADDARHRTNVAIISGNNSLPRGRVNDIIQDACSRKKESITLETELSADVVNSLLEDGFNVSGKTISWHEELSGD